MQLRRTASSGTCMHIEPLSIDYNLPSRFTCDGVGCCDCWEAGREKEEIQTKSKKKHYQKKTRHRQILPSFQLKNPQIAFLAVVKNIIYRKESEKRMVQGLVKDSVRDFPFWCLFSMSV